MSPSHGPPIRFPYKVIRGTSLIVSSLAWVVRHALTHDSLSIRVRLWVPAENFQIRRFMPHMGELELEILGI